MTRKITAAMIENWILAARLTTPTRYLDLLAQLANKEYAIDKFINDVIDYDEVWQYEEIEEEEEVKSCRNCTRSVHDGYFWVSLKCNATGKMLVDYCKNPDENKAYDAQVIAYAAKCEHYVSEKQV